MFPHLREAIRDGEQPEVTHKSTNKRKTIYEDQAHFWEDAENT